MTPAHMLGSLFGIAGAGYGAQTINGYDNYQNGYNGGYQDYNCEFFNFNTYFLQEKLYIFNNCCSL